MDGCKINKEIRIIFDFTSIFDTYSLIYCIIRKHIANIDPNLKLNNDDYIHIVNKNIKDAVKDTLKIKLKENYD